MIINDAHIKNHISNWLYTLPNDLQGKVKDHLIVAGGAITSTLLNEKINDYDVFILSSNIRKKIKNYYLKLINKENVDLEKTPFLNIPMKEDASAYPIFLTKNAITLSNRIQIIIKDTDRTYLSAEEIVSEFDFIHTKNYWSFHEGIVVNKDALYSTITKKLFYTGSKYPITSLFRALKFQKRGWKLDGIELTKIAFQISELDLNNPVVFREQLFGIDIAVMGRLIEKLKDVERINYDLLCSMLTKTLTEITEIEE